MGEFIWKSHENAHDTHQPRQNLDTSSFISSTTTTIMQDANNVSIDLGLQYEQPNERLSPSLSHSNTPLGVYLVPDVKPFKEVDDDNTKKNQDMPPLTTLTTTLKQATVDALTFPVMNLSIDDEIPENSFENDSDDPDPLTQSSFEEARSAAMEVNSFLLDQQQQRNNDGPVPVALKRGRFQRRNSFVIHRKRSRSLQDRELALLPPPLLTSGTPKFDMSGARSQSEGTLMGPTTPHESTLGLHRLSLPWKRKKRNPESSSQG